MTTAAAAIRPAPSGALRPSIFILVAVTAVNPLSLNLYVPSMPSVQQDFDALAAVVQLTLSLGLAGTALVQLAIGPLSDRYGRRPVLLTGLMIAVLASLYCTFTTSLEGLIVGRIIQVAGGAAGLVLGRVIVRDLHAPSEAASMLGYVTMGMAMAPMIAPTIGGFLDDQISWRAGFAFSGLFALTILISAWYTLPETNRYLGKTTSIAKMLRDYGTLSGYRDFWLYTMVCAFTGGTFFSFLGGAPYVSSQIFGMGPTEYGLFFALVATGYSIGNYLSGRYTGHFGLFRMMLSGNLVTLAACLFVISLSAFGVENPVILFGAMGFLGIGNGMTLPSANVGIVSVLPELAGTASGYSGFLVTLVCAFFSYVVAFTLSDSVMPMALMMTFCCVAAIACTRAVRESADTEAISD